MFDCPSCGTEMERSRKRAIQITLSGSDVPGEDVQETDDESPDELVLICPECGYTESEDYRGEEDEAEGI